MKKIEKFENAKLVNKPLKEQGINSTIYSAYFRTLETENDLLDFRDVIWEYDIKDIIDFCY